MGKFILGRRRKATDGEHSKARQGSERTGGAVASVKQQAGVGGSAAASKARKARTAKATSVAAVVAAAPVYSKFSASHKQSAAAARAARLEVRRGVPTASSNEDDGMITPPCCSRVTSAVDESHAQMSTHSPQNATVADCTRAGPRTLIESACRTLATHELPPLGHS